STQAQLLLADASPLHSRSGKSSTPGSGMARKPPAPIQRLLFPPDSGEIAIPQALDLTKGTPHELQNHLPPADPGSTGDVRPTPERADAAADADPAGERNAGQAPGLEGPTGGGSSAQQPDAAGERGAGDRHQGTGGLFAARYAANRGRAALPR